MHEPAASANNIPCVVQVGFASSRRLFDPSPADADLQRQWGEAVCDHLAATLSELSAKLKLSPNHFLCTISQVAIGADMAFTAACGRLQIPQRFFLPQDCNAYLTAVGAGGESNFDDAQRQRAEALLEADHVIQKRVVSQSTDRRERSWETNAEILRVSDFVIGLLRVGADGKPGGTQAFIERATTQLLHLESPQRRNKKVVL